MALDEDDPEEGEVWLLSVEALGVEAFPVDEVLVVAEDEFVAGVVAFS